MNLDEALLSVWRQSLEEALNLVELDGKRFPVRRSQRRRLRQVDFEFDGQQIRGLEQNPETHSRWAELVRGGQKVMQFLSGGRYVANVADGRLTHYQKSGAGLKKAAATGSPRDASPSKDPKQQKPGEQK